MNLEDRFFYRLVKASNYFLHSIFFIICFLILCDNIPDADIPDNTRSYIVCDNGKVSKPLNKAGVEIYKYSKKLSMSDDEDALRFCASDSKGKITDPVLLSMLNHNLTAVDKNYKLKIFYEPRDWVSYWKLIRVCLFIYAIFYIFTNIIKEALIYVAFGRKFTWIWLKNIINKLRAFYDFCQKV